MQHQTKVTINSGFKAAFSESEAILNSTNTEQAQKQNTGCMFCAKACNRNKQLKSLVQKHVLLFGIRV